MCPWIGAGIWGGGENGQSGPLVKVKTDWWGWAGACCQAWGRCWGPFIRLKLEHCLARFNTQSSCTTENILGKCCNFYLHYITARLGLNFKSLLWAIYSRKHHSYCIALRCWRHLQCKLLFLKKREIATLIYYKVKPQGRVRTGTRSQFCSALGFVCEHA